jgi:hypothetical protein
MENWSPHTFAALKNLPLAQQQEKSLAKSFDKAVKNFKRNLREKLKLEYSSKTMISNPKRAYIQNLA